MPGAVRVCQGKPRHGAGPSPACTPGRAEHPEQEPRADPSLPILPRSPWVGGHHCRPRRDTGTLPTSAVLDGQGDDGDAEQQCQGDGDGAEHQLQLAARGQAAQQRPRPLPKPHLGRSRTRHRTVGGTEPRRSPFPPLLLPGAWLGCVTRWGPGHPSAGTQGTSPGEPAVAAGSPPSRKEGRRPGHNLCRILAASQHIPGDSQGWLGSRPCSR